MIEIPVEALRERLTYDADTGVLFWSRSPCNRVKAGAKAGHIGNHGYHVLCIMGKKILVHRIVWAMHYGEWPERDIDHRNHCTTDNRIDNLRLAGNQQNQFNRKINNNNKSGHKGVYWHKRDKVWCVSATYNQRKVHIGTYHAKEAAAKAYLAFAKVNHGEFFYAGE